MEEDRKKSRTGIASMLKQSEIKGYVDRLFLLILGGEVLIFVAHFAGAVGPGNGVFPWKQYFFISFITPVALPFLTGLVVMGFNYFLFGDDAPPPEEERQQGYGKGLGQRTRRLLLFLNQIPVLGSLLAIGAGSVILQVVGHVGERTLFYLAVILAIALIPEVLDLKNIAGRKSTGKKDCGGSG